MAPDSSQGEFNPIHLVICIPIHGHSIQLEKCLLSIDQNIRTKHSEHLSSCTLLLSNSGGDTRINSFWKGDYKVISNPSSYYWCAGVKSLFIEAQKYKPTHLLLMNHDVLLFPDTFAYLIKYATQFPSYILSSVSIAGSPCIVENAGFNYTNGSLPLITPYANESCELLPSEPYRVDLLNGKFVLFPACAANPNYLYPELVPHYFADAVLSGKARMNGYPLLVIPNSKVASDQSDREFKLIRQRCQSLKGIYNCLFMPYSYRYLWGSFWGQILLSQNTIRGYVFSTYFTAGRIAKSFLELLRIIDPL